MRYLFLGLILLILSGCGGDNNNSSSDTMKKPSVPQTTDISKQPPSIPTL